jgi:hypothetical protein
VLRGDLMGGQVCRAQLPKWSAVPCAVTRIAMHSAQSTGFRSRFSSCGNGTAISIAPASDVGPHRSVPATLLTIIKATVRTTVGVCLPP